MSLSNKKKTQSTSNIFDDDFEVIYEGDLPDISIDDDDDYRDVLSGLSDIDHTDYAKSLCQTIGIVCNGFLCLFTDRLSRIYGNTVS